MVKAIHHTALLSTLLLVVAAFGGVCCLEEERVVSLQQLQWGDDQKSPPNSHLYSRQQAASRTVKSTAVLELKHHISSSVTNFTEQLLLSDEARVSSLQSKFKSFSWSPNQQPEARIPLTSGAALQTLNYIVTIKIGGEDVSVIVDTGSDLTWVQCKPCAYCYAQHDPLYDPSASATYRPIPCNSTSCTSLTTSGSCGGLDRNACNYGLRYGDGSYTSGVLAREQIGLGDATVEEFIFGCGRSNRGLFGGASGIVGLGRSRLSLVSQTEARFGGVFSYCLPSRVYNSSGNLVLGNDPSNYKNATSIAYTRMVQGPRPTLPFYFLNLTGVRLGGVEVGTSKGVRVLIDSGTVITRLVPSMYDAVRDEFVRQFSAEYPAALGFSILDTCFDLSRYDRVRVPKLGFGFEGGAGMNVDVTGILYFVKKDASQVCLAMTSLASEDGVGIIGNYQQKNQRVVYDSEGGRVGFGEEKCSYGG